MSITSVSVSTGPPQPPMTRSEGPVPLRPAQRGIRKARTAGFDVSVIFTVSRANIHELQLMGPLLQSLEVKRFFIQVIGIRGRSVTHRSDDLQVGKKEWIKTVPAAAEGIARLGLTVTFPKVFLTADDTFECAGKSGGKLFYISKRAGVPLSSLRGLSYSQPGNR